MDNGQRSTSVRVPDWERECVCVLKQRVVLMLLPLLLDSSVLDADEGASDDGVRGAHSL